MKFIVITSPCHIPDEAQLIDILFDNGLDILHLRKPEWGREECERLIKEIMPRDEGTHAISSGNHIVVHDHHSLCREYGLQGIHLNRRNPVAGIPREGHTISASCHTIEEVEQRKPSVDYLFLSPIFDSISKKGYNAAFTPRELREASMRGIIDSKVVALGGVSLERLPLLGELGFGGAAFLGDVWRYNADKEAFALHARRLAEALHAI